MTAHVPARQPFAVLDSPRLHALASTKNRQNSIPAPFSIASDDKPVLASPQKRRYSPSSFDDDVDSENVDPSLQDSPTKRSKAHDGSPQKPAKFILTNSTSLSSTPSARFITPSSSAARQANKTHSVPTKSPIGNSRGSPKHKRIGLLSRRRTASSTITRVDPPAFGRSPRRSAGLPFSIDAALSGTIPTYTPSPKVEAAKPAVAEIPILDDAMPNGWFFEIHEDTAEQHATNLMEHSACVLDISSDDDSDTKAINEAQERGKENIPPPDFQIASDNAPANSDSSISSTELASEVKSKPGRKYDEDAMQEDRSPLSDLPASDYFGDGLNASSHIVIDGDKASTLSKDCTADLLGASTPADKAEEVDADEGTEDSENTAPESESTAHAQEQKEDIVVFDEASASDPAEEASGVA